MSNAKKSTNSTSEKVKVLTEKLEAGIQDMFDSGKVEQYLKAMALFSNYSAHNTILILSQNPSATKVAGYKTWEKLGRQVKKGEKAIQILSPRLVKYKEKKKDENGNETDEEIEVSYTKFVPSSVFDISQTEGDEFPDISKKIDINLEDCDTFIDALEQVSSYKIEYKKNMSKDYLYDSLTNTIHINGSLSDIQLIKTIVSAVITTDVSVNGFAMREDAERIAEMSAYIVCQTYNIDTSAFSFGSVIEHMKKKEMKELKKDLNMVQKKAKNMIDSIDKVLQN